MAWLENPIRGLLLDISGVLKNGHIPIEGSVEAIKRLQESKIPFRLLSNETQLAREVLRAELAKIGFNVDTEDIFCPAPAMAQILRERKLKPHLLIHPGIVSEFDQVSSEDELDCVVMGDATDNFTYENMNKAFNILLNLKKKDKEPKFFTLGLGKYYLEPFGLCLDVGPFTVALEYATGLKAELIGKPSPKFFSVGLESLKLAREEVVMIGDDIVGDVGGAQKFGMRGVLVRTGKFQVSDEKHPEVKPDAIVANLKEAVELILSQHGPK